MGRLVRCYTVSNSLLMHNETEFPVHKCAEVGHQSVLLRNQYQTRLPAHSLYLGDWLLSIPGTGRSQLSELTVSVWVLRCVGYHHISFMRIALWLICNYTIDTWIKVESLTNITNLNRITVDTVRALCWQNWQVHNCSLGSPRKQWRFVGVTLNLAEHTARQLFLWIYVLLFYVGTEYRLLGLLSFWTSSIVQYLKA
jgi:hypothetical protein